MDEVSGAGGEMDGRTRVCEADGRLARGEDHAREAAVRVEGRRVRRKRQGEGRGETEDAEDVRTCGEAGDRKAWDGGGRRARAAAGRQRREERKSGGAACGMPLWNAFVPNVASPTVAELRRRGVFAWFGDVKDILARWEGDWGCFEGVWLDYCGGISKRTQDVKHVFERGVLARGGVLAMACSSQDSALATQSDPIKPVEFSMQIVQDAASAHGYELIPALETSAGNGKDGTDLLEQQLAFHACSGTGAFSSSWLELLDCLQAPPLPTRGIGMHDG
eukprot:CAMPEP_0113922262 /NCGR_PEP_ID=MMETSP1159-20121227/1516_1 /TAXON_ID=88271 /ORGANISM="Picocystis salinarum" /LENGTH=276 /DNA_ID=CAMNT_0000922353 /DNA_START=3 /DNA_END=835 /DNA_ORIENTATION=+ /assembly_acc=CAM_ASM_000767